MHCYAGFPIQLGANEEEKKKKEKVPTPKIEGKVLIDFIMLFHGSYWPIWKIREEFVKQHPEITSRLIKKKVREISTKEKKPGDLKVRTNSYIDRSVTM
jgi:hypothetical protein